MSFWSDLGKSRKERISHTRERMINTMGHQAATVAKLPKLFEKGLDTIESIPVIGDAVRLLPGEGKVRLALEKINEVEEFFEHAIHPADYLKEKARQTTQELEENIGEFKHALTDTFGRPVKHMNEMGQWKNEHGLTMSRMNFPLPHNAPVADIDPNLARGISTFGGIQAHDMIANDTSHINLLHQSAIS